MSDNFLLLASTLAAISLFVVGSITWYVGDHQTAIFLMIGLMQLVIIPRHADGNSSHQSRRIGSRPTQHGRPTSGMAGKSTQG